MFQYVTNCVRSDDSDVRQRILVESSHNPRDVLNHPVVKLLTAWKNILIVLAKNDVSFHFVYKTAILYLSLCIRKPIKCLCENKGADQLRGKGEADQCFCFR